MSLDDFVSSASTFGISVRGVSSPFPDTAQTGTAGNSSFAVVSEELQVSIEQIKCLLFEQAGLLEPGRIELTEYDHTLVNLLSGLLVDWDNRYNPDMETFQSVVHSMVSALTEGFNPDNHFSAPPLDWSSYEMLAQTFESMGGDLFEPSDQSSDSPHYLNLKFTARLTEILAGWSKASGQGKGRNMIMCRELRKGVKAILSGPDSIGTDSEIDTSGAAPEA